MQFPYYFHLAGYTLHPHPVMEMLAYFVGARVYGWTAWEQRAPGNFEQKLIVLVGCIFGAWVGSKLLAWAESPSVYLESGFSISNFLKGKTIVGGLLGGWAGVEIAKRGCGIRESTGDVFVLPLAIGTAIGRIGCFLTGLADKTYGISTDLPWAIDFGDDIRRHPTQLYESGFVLIFGICLFLERRRLRVNGELFRAYLVGYFGFRFLIEFIKPRELLAGSLSAIQVACVLGFVWTAFSWTRLPPSSSASLTRHV